MATGGAQLRAHATPVIADTLIGIGVGCVAGLLSYSFLRSLEWATNTRVSHSAIIWFLPLAGLVIGIAYHYGGGRAQEGNTLLWNEVHEVTFGIPRRMAPMVFAGGVITHLFGGSGGREGAALQMTASVSDGIARLLHIGKSHRRVIVLASFAGGFGAIFGTPVAGAVFALEAPFVGGFQLDGLLPALTASIVGDLVVRELGYHHSIVAAIPRVNITALVLLKTVAAGIAFGLAARAFVWLTRTIKVNATRFLRFTPLRPMLGGAVVLALVGLSGSRAYLGLSLPLISNALIGVKLAFAVFAWKLLFTAVTIGTGFPGGEVTPLFCIGATLGAALATPLGLPVGLVAGLGYVAVFGAAANTPIALTIVAAEVFGAGVLPLVALSCAVAYLVSPHRGIYGSQRVIKRKVTPR